MIGADVLFILPSSYFTNSFHCVLGWQETHRRPHGEDLCERLLWNSQSNTEHWNGKSESVMQWNPWQKENCHWIKRSLIQLNVSQLVNEWERVFKMTNSFSHNCKVGIN